MGKKLIPLGLILSALVVSLLLGEFVARLVVNPGDFLIATMVDDPILGRRIAPHTTGHDGLGFRNSHVPAQADVVAIGDSLTYGFSAPREGSWPALLSDLLHTPVYNMGIGGIGPLQYLYLVGHQAKQLHPRLILVGFYFGNDLADAYYVAQKLPYWRNWRQQGSAYRGESEHERVLNAEPRKRFAALRDWLSRHSVLYEMLKVTVLQRVVLWEKVRAAAKGSPDRELAWFDPENRSVRTIFTPDMVLSALDLRLPTVDEGMRITEKAFAAMSQEAKAEGARLLVVLIPTKERAYCSYLKHVGTRLPPAFVQLCSAEQDVKGRLQASLTGEGVPFTDVTRALEKQIRDHVQLYPADADGHLLTSGNSVVARAITNAVRRELNGN